MKISAARGGDEALKQRKSRTGQHVAVSDNVWGVAVSPDGLWFATYGGRGNLTDVALFDATTGEHTDNLRHKVLGAAVTCVAWRFDARMLATGTSDGTVKVYDVSTRTTWDTVTSEQLEPSWGMNESNSINSLTWSPDGLTVCIAIGSWARMFSVDTRSLSDVILYDVEGVAWGSSDERLVATWCMPSQEDDMWAVKQLQLMRTKGKQLMHSGNWVVKLQSTLSESSEDVLTGHDDFVSCVAWSPDGNTLASSSKSGTTILWDTAAYDRRIKYILRGHTNKIVSVAWSQDGNVLATASSDHTVRLWNTATGRPTGFWGRPEDGSSRDKEIVAVAWSPCGWLVFQSTRSGGKMLINTFFAVVRRGM